MKLAIVSTTAALTLAAFPVRAEPAIVLTPASAAPAAPLESRCSIGPEQAGRSQVECIVEQRAMAGSTAPASLRIVIYTDAGSAPCRMRDAQEVAFPGLRAAPTPRPGVLPQVVQEGRGRACAA